MGLSVIVPVHNDARFLAEAVASIGAATSEPPEIVIVDDASTDGTDAVAADLAARIAGCRYRRLPRNLGPGPARNVGLELAQGDEIAFLDADDRYVPGALDLLRARLAAQPQADIAMGRIRVIRSTDRGEALASFTVQGSAIRCFQLGSIVARRTVFEIAGAFDPAYRYGEDIDWFMRLQEHRVKFDLCDEVVLLHRRHASNMTDHDPNGLVDMALVMRASLARRKKLAQERGVDVTEIYYVKPDQLRVADA